MIVRLLQARIAARHVTRFNLLLRQQLELLRVQPGLEYVKLARRLQPGGGEDVLLFEEWLTPGDVYRWVGPNLSEPRLIAGARELIETITVSHYEALDRELATNGTLETTAEEGEEERAG